MIRVGRVVGAAAVALLLTVGGVAPAYAALDTDGREAALWYADRMKFDDIRDKGLTGEGVTIAVIDDAINTDVAELKGADIEVRGQFCRDAVSGDELPATTDDPSRFHGTNVTSMLVGTGVAADGGAGARGIVPDASVKFYAAADPASDASKDCAAYNPVTGEFAADRKPDVSDGEYDVVDDAILSSPTAVAADQALADGVDIINVSSLASVWDNSSWSPVAVKALRAGVPIVAGTLNPDATTQDILNLLPAGLNGSVAVGGVDNDGKPIRGVDPTTGIEQESRGISNLGFAGPAFQMLVPAAEGAWEPGLGSGTSLATPLVAGTIALGLEKYPEASAFQVLQAMVRTTGAGEQHEPEWGGVLYGYGIVNPMSMLAVDPTQFPDENPLFVASSDDPRCGSGAAGATPNDDDPLANCAWAAGPSAEMVGSGPEPGTETTADDAATDGQSALMPILIVGGVLLLGVVAAAIIVPIVVVRSRKNLSYRNTQQHEEYVS
ncbi:S8/S53 family peptidase [Leucobacter sp. USHLN153]|uniref:S8/S53 family peptidase n=1 Tax=Leucobacter sp. USHLN153 TaxID=3081268 RepID=UPI0030162BF9